MRHIWKSLKVCTELQLSSDSCPVNYSCHYAVRSPFTTSKKNIENGNLSLSIPYEQWYTKTGGKVSTAAACHSNVITSLDPAVRELIDESYPYAIDTESEEFSENWKEICEDMFRKAKSDYNNSRWKEGLKIMEQVRERTLTRRIVSDYVNFGIKIREIN